MTDTKRDHALVTKRTVRATIDEAYTAWTDGALLRKWFGTVVEADVRVGGRYRVENHEDGKVYAHKGQFLALEPGKRVVMTFTYDGEPLAGIDPSAYWDEIVEVTFRALGPRSTEVTLRNAWNGKGMSDDEREGLDKGWAEWLDRYEKALES